MNCKLCKENLEAYLAGSLPEDMAIRVKTHLDGCAECSAWYASFLISEKIVSEEKQLEPNPFLSTRVMAKIEALEEAYAKPAMKRKYKRIWQPVFISVSIALAVLAGIWAGNLYSRAQSQNPVPEELVYLDDAALESLPVLLNE